MIRQLLRYLYPQRGLMATVMATMLATTLVEMASPWPLKLVIDNVLGLQPLFGRDLEGGSQQAVLALAAVGFVLLAALKGSLVATRTRWLTQLSQGASLDMRRDLYAQLQRLSLRFHDTSRKGDTITRITSDVDKLQDAFVTGLSLFSVDLLTVLGIAGVMFIVDWQFALVAMGVLPALGLLFSVFRRRVRDASRDVRASEGGIASVAQEALSSIRVVKAFGQEDWEQERFDTQAKSKVDAAVRVATWEGLLSLWVELAAALGIAAVLWYGGWRVLSGDLTVGEMVLFMQYLVTLYTPLRRLSRLTTVVQKAAASGERIYEIFQLEREVPESPTAVPVTRPHGRITFQGVGFEYFEGQPVLHGVDLEIRSGETLALVGPTGAGKSTIVSLIARFYDPTEGRIMLDGIDLRQIKLRSLREQVSIVLQDPVLFSGTIRENIAYADPDAREERVLAAAKAANAHEFIGRLPEGYDAAVGERGVTLSGGQRQRIAIARALLKDSPILILDEPTSAVDRHSEALIMEALGRLIEGRTVVLIAHRLATLDLVDRVALLVDGSVVQVGKPHELRQVTESFLSSLLVPGPEHVAAGRRGQAMPGKADLA